MWTCCNEWAGQVWSNGKHANTAWSIKAVKPELKTDLHQTMNSFFSVPHRCFVVHFFQNWQRLLEHPMVLPKNKEASCIVCSAAVSWSLKNGIPVMQPQNQLEWYLLGKKQWRGEKRSPPHTWWDQMWPRQAWLFNGHFTCFSEFGWCN